MQRIITSVFLLVLLMLAAAACQSSPGPSSQPAGTTAAEPAAAAESAPIEQGPRFGQAVAPGPQTPDGLGVATFAGGCFWCMEPPFDAVQGVVSTTSGYTGGPETDPSYKQVASGGTGHTEAVLVVFDPKVVAYDQLLEVFWRSHDPTDASGQFADRGSQYRPAIFYHSEEQKAAAQASRQKLADSGKFDAPIAVKIEPAQPFWPAEEYHQDYYRKNPGHYKSYSRGSGRVGFLKKHWGSP